MSTRIALGLAALGRPAYINLGSEGALPAVRDVASMRAATFAVLDDAYAAGIRHVDVARSYGRSEEFLAGWLAERGHAGIEVSSKWGYAYVGEWRLDADVHEVKEHSAARFAAQWAETLALLGDRVGLYQVHSLTVDSPLFTDEPLLEALAELSANGVAVGFSTSGPAQAAAIERAFALEVAGRPVFSAVQSTWNVLEPSAGPALAAAHAAGKRVLVKETLANGRLAVEAPAGVRELATAHGTGPDAVAVAAVLANAWVDRAVLGPASPAQLAANLRGATLSLSTEEEAVLAGLAENPEQYWRHRSSLAWR
ncbi:MULTISPECIES: aldo/keto reductase [unclassified Amycolatopsis]|uniref:aldo/keto reductase n=1 Tax=unclassified Amycolatopsis TaxID=2618356 RepID=UPI0028748116|nr:MULTISPECIES: aldo/keto reductase [unclassified Amycolatopsis]MDS0136961.1 aldo/keto reductase [Amycolatopsis sp. 505]MDS0143626.1 aldo/keto reductase [Amycolatopsis sp. CM201R]